MGEGSDGLIMLYAQVHLTLPPWVHQLDLESRLYADDDTRIALAIALARHNVERRSGGPFGAALFTSAGRLLGVGVNRVIEQNCSIAHAEMMAFMCAQGRLARHRLNEDGMRVVLATSAQPCCQCYGAAFWAGIDELLIGARSEDVMRLTAFDEGPLPADWIGELEHRGIAVKRDLRRDEACAVLAAYTAAAGATY